MLLSLLPYNNFYSLRGGDHVYLGLPFDCVLLIPHGQVSLQCSPVALGINILIWFGILEGALWLIRRRRRKEQGVVESDHAKPIPLSDWLETSLLILLMAAITINLWLDPLRIAYRSELQAVAVNVIATGFVILAYLICPSKPRFGKVTAFLLAAASICLMILIAAHLYLRLHSETAQERIRKNVMQIDEAVKAGNTGTNNK